jgi:transketolase
MNIYSSQSDGPKFKGKHSLILARTTKGKRISLIFDQASWHHHVPNDKEFAAAMSELQLAEEYGRFNMELCRPNLEVFGGTLQEGLHNPFKIIGIPDEYTVNGSQAEIFEYYGITPEGLAQSARELIQVEVYK